jgi:hypothetical protein
MKNTNTTRIAEININTLAYGAVFTCPIGKTGVVLVQRPDIFETVVAFRGDKKNHFIPNQTPVTPTGHVMGKC